MEDLSRFLVVPDVPIREVIALIDRNASGIALVADTQRRLLGTVTDGDIRRAILARVDLDNPVRDLLASRDVHRPSRPLTVLVGASDAEALRLMNESGLRHIPILDGEGRIVDIAILSRLLKKLELPLEAVVMAGGYGKRMQPLTARFPKPMLPLGGQPLLERIIVQLRRAGIRRVSLATHYMTEVITNYFGDGSNFGVAIRYVDEDQPMGTAGALGRISNADDPLLIINGDILTRVNFRAMLDYHNDQRASMTVAVRPHEIRVPFGVVETKGVEITRIVEKPVWRPFISAGIYLVSADVCRLVSNDRHWDMTDLIQELLAHGQRVVSFPIREYWRDVGQPEDYQQAEADVRSGEYEA